MLYCYGLDVIAAQAFIFFPERSKLHGSYSGVILTQNLLMLGGIDIVGWVRCCKEVPMVGWGRSYHLSRGENRAGAKGLLLGGIYVIGWGSCYKVPIYGRGRSYALLINWGESRSSEEGLLGSGMISCKVIMIGCGEYSNRIGSGEQGAIASCIAGVDNTGCEQKEHQHELKIHELNRQPKKCKTKGCLEIGWLFLL